ncbi:MAG: T9SS type A sorting domain-containing protein [Bacteroidetes bacterium]|nr:T9SS type A sorting domain-containing protein [Bacteroidota bacterium]
MRKAFLTICIGLLSAAMYGQTILNINLVPPNPTTQDSITIIAEMAYPSGGCDTRDPLIFTLSGNSVYAITHHCIGMLAVICNDIDTFSIGKLQAGTYTFNLTSTAGALPWPCSPGIVPTLSTVSFAVSNANSINETSLGGATIFYSGNMLTIASQLPLTTGSVINIYNMTGQRIHRAQLEAVSKQQIPISLTNGAYMVEIQNAEGKKHGQQKIVVVN